MLKSEKWITNKLPFGEGSVIKVLRIGLLVLLKLPRAYQTVGIVTLVAPLLVMVNWKLILPFLYIHVWWWARHG